MSNWKLWAALVAALLLGIGIGAQAADTVEVVREVEVIREVEVPVEVIQEVGSERLDECLAYIDWIFVRMDVQHDIVGEMLLEMADILDRDGYMVVSEYVDIVDTMTARLNEETAWMLTQEGFACL